MTAPRFPLWPYMIALALIFAGAMAPIAITIYAVNVTEGHGCTVSVAQLYPCIIDGVDKGPELQAMAHSFWYALYTWPAGILAACLWLGILWFHRRRWSRRMGYDD